MDPLAPLRYNILVAPSPAPHRRLAALVALGLTALPAACARDRQATPRDVAEASVEAMIKGDIDLTRALLAPPDLLRERLECPPGGNDIVTQLIDDAPLVAERVRLTREALAGAKGTLREFDRAGSRDYVIPAGEPFRGCTTATELHLHDAEVVVRLTRAGRPSDDRQTLHLVELDGRWYLLE